MILFSPGQGRQLVGDALQHRAPALLGRLALLPGEVQVAGHLATGEDVGMPGDELVRDPTGHVLDVETTRLLAGDLRRGRPPAAAGHPAPREAGRGRRPRWPQRSPRSPRSGTAPANDGSAGRPRGSLDRSRAITSTRRSSSGSGTTAGQGVGPGAGLASEPVRSPRITFCAGSSTPNRGLSVTGRSRTAVQVGLGAHPLGHDLLVGDVEGDRPGIGHGQQTGQLAVLDQGLPLGVGHRRCSGRRRSARPVRRGSSH